MRLFRLGIDATVAGVALVLGYCLAIGNWAPWDVGDPAALFSAAIAYGATAALVGFLQRTYRSSWRFASITDMLSLVRAATVTAGLFLALAFVFNRAQGYPRSTFILAWGLHVCGLAGVRLVVRAMHEKTLLRALLPSWPSSRVILTGTPLLLVGEPDQAEAFLRELDRGPRPAFSPVGIIAPTNSWTGSDVRKVTVLGALDAFEPLLAAASKRYPTKLAILFLDEQHGALPTEVLARLKREGFSLLRRRRVDELVGSEATPYRELSFEELLFRKPVRLDPTRAARFLAGKRVLVTGAGGSIGSELCRQLADLGAAHLCLLDFSEYNLFEIDCEIADRHPSLSRTTALCNIRDQATVERWIEAQRPDVLFHAAALKHVPLVESHPAEGVLTNVLGTANVALAAERLGVPHFVMLSTDKAVSPSNIMGATKRLAEDFVRGLADHDGAHGTGFQVVRFGNVLGSAGSVVPTFRNQIQRGGPVTITHPDVERFFMTIPEAVQLVLHASAVGSVVRERNASVFVLDMGQPVKILDLARQVIRLHGLEPDVDILIKIIGLRPGEKLSEELVDSDEQVTETGDGIMKIRSTGPARSLALSHLRRLEALSIAGDDAALRQMVKGLVKTCTFASVAA